MKNRARRLEIGCHGLEVVSFAPPPEKAPTLVFLHPGLGSASTWRDLPERLAAATGCGALVYSRAGHGASDAEEEPLALDFMQREGLEILPRLVEMSGLESFVLVGHSDGGSIALVYAGGVGHPGLRGVATLAAHAFCEELTVETARQAAKEFQTGDLRERLERHHGDKSAWVFDTWFDVWTHPHFAAWSIEGFLPPIDIPVLIVQGADDPYGTRAQVDALASGVGSTADVLWLADCGHAPHRDAPLEVEARLIDFVNRTLVTDIKTEVGERR